MAIKEFELGRSQRRMTGIMTQKHDVENGATEDKETSKEKRFCDPSTSNITRISNAQGVKKAKRCCSIPHRYILLILMFSLTAVIYSTRISFALALVAMVNMTGSDVNTSSECSAGKADNFSTLSMDGEFNWDSKLQSHILSSFYYMYMILQIPGGQVAERYGGKWVMFTCTLISGILFTLIPLIARLSVYALIAVQAISGLVQGAIFPAMMAMWARWAPMQERTVLVGNSLAGNVVGQLFAYGLTGYLCDSDFLGGWPSVFYLFGILTLILCIIFGLVVHDSPATDPTISDEERKYIECGTDKADHVKHRYPPYKAILTSMPVWASVAAISAAKFWQFVMSLTIPFYMKQILRFTNTQIGTVSTIPIIMQVIGGFIFSFLIDFLRARHIISTTVARKAATFIGTVMVGIVFVLIPVVRCNKVAAIILFTISAILSGASSSGFVINVMDLAPIYSGTLYGCFNLISNLCGFISPLAVEALSGLSNDIDGWSNVFYVTSAVISSGGLFFMIFGSGEVQEWAKPVMTDEQVSKTMLSGETLLTRKPEIELEDDAI